MDYSEHTSSTLLEPKERVLPTLEHDGKRRWIFPRISVGFFFRLRRLLGFSLIILFVSLPWWRINSKPVFLIDVIDRELTLLGYTFLPTDTLFLAFFMVGLFLTVFFFTALFGRVWCGWGCPQTVYMEFVFRPIERFFNGTIGRGGNPRNKLSTINKVLMYASYLVICFLLANVFLSYFVGTDRLMKWVQLSPVEHPGPFITMGIVTVAMMFDFCFFREQLCLIACPYGRFQSVLLDRKSLIVTYDNKRGEPRGHQKKTNPVVFLETLKSNTQADQQGDCIDCSACVRTCPTGIDIRDGLQLECIHCTQCIDACDNIMNKVGKPAGLIRYSCQDAIDGKPHSILRPRVIIYPVVICIIATLFAVLFINKKNIDYNFIRDGLYTMSTDKQTVKNTFKIHLSNRLGKDTIVGFKVTKPETGVVITPESSSFNLKSGTKLDKKMTITANPELFKTDSLDIEVEISNTQGDKYYQKLNIFGPRLKKSN